MPTATTAEYSQKCGYKLYLYVGGGGETKKETLTLDLFVAFSLQPDGDSLFMMRHGGTELMAIFG